MRKKLEDSLIVENARLKTLVDNLKEDLELAKDYSREDQLVHDIKQFELAIREWHDATHNEGWPICQSTPCKAAQGRNK